MPWEEMSSKTIPKTSMNYVFGLYNKLHTPLKYNGAVDTLAHALLKYKIFP
jgi:hypothetical protein